MPPTGRGTPQRRTSRPAAVSPLLFLTHGTLDAQPPSREQEKTESPSEPPAGEPVCPSRPAPRPPEAAGAIDPPRSRILRCGHEPNRAGRFRVFREVRRALVLLLLALVLVVPAGCGGDDSGGGGGDGGTNTTK